MNPPTIKNILTIRTVKGQRKKEVEFNAAKHTVLLGDLCDKDTLQPIGKIIKVEGVSENSQSLG